MASGEGDGVSRNPVVASISSRRRREILRLLLHRNSRVTVHELATRLVSTHQRTSPTTRTSARAQSAETELYHNHLPRLADVGLVTWNADAGTVEADSHPALDDVRFRLLLESRVDGLDEALEHVANERHRIVLTTLREADTSMTETDLARELLRSASTDFDPATDAVDDVIASLQHIHLPALDEGNLVEYDPEAGRAADAGHPGFDALFTIVFETETRLVDRYDDFFGGLGDASSALTREASEMTGWPHFWGDHHHG